MSSVTDLKNLLDFEFFHDEPDEKSNVFEYHEFCNNIVNIILKQKDTPFSILIHSEWGSGKTSALIKTRDLLKNREKDDRNLKVIYFEVWKYEKIDPVASLLEEIKNMVGANNTNFERVVKGIGLLLFDMAIRAHTSLTLDEAKKYFETSHNSIRDLRKEIEKTMEDKKLVILVDELDRCSFETMLEMIDSIRLFLNAKGIICIVAADNEKLRSAWTNRYPTADKKETDEYFDKIFQLKLALPSKEDKMLDNYIMNLKPPYIGEEEKELISKCTSNPRKVKQILNLIFFGLKYGNLVSKPSDGNLNSYYPVIVTWSIISILYPTFGKELKIHLESLNDSLDFISLIRTEYEEEKVDITERNKLHKVFNLLNKLEEFDDEFHLRKKYNALNIWSQKSITNIARNFELFQYLWYLQYYLGGNTDSTHTDWMNDYMETRSFVSNEILSDVVKKLGILI